MNDIQLTTTTIMALIAVVGLIILVIGAGVFKFRPRSLNNLFFQKRWQEVQALCGDKNTWPLAIINADKLVDDALRKRHYKGKTMGERLVSAQREFSDNDGVWFGHKLRNRLVHEDNVRLKEHEVKQALVGFRQALKDVGALPR